MEEPNKLEALGPVMEGLGFLRSVCYDLETTDLHALMGRILCASFQDMETGETWTLRGDDPEYLNPDDPIDDSYLVEAIRDTLEKYDVWIGQNHLLFDNKMLKARLLKWGHRLPEPRWQVDIMWLVRTHFKMSSKLENIAKYLGLEAKPSPTWDEWSRAAAGHRESMNIIVDRCEADVRITSDAARRLKPAIRTLQRKG